MNSSVKFNEILISQPEIKFFTIREGMKTIDMYIDISPSSELIGASIADSYNTSPASTITVINSEGQDSLTSNLISSVVHQIDMTDRFGLVETIRILLEEPITKL